MTDACGRGHGPPGPDRCLHVHGEDTPALRDVAVSVLPGSLTAVLGGSGSGKSTLGKLLAGWLRAGHAGELRGSLELDGTRLDFRGLPEDPRINPAEWSRRVAFVPQDAAAMLSTVRATVAEELAFGLENRAVPREDMLRAVERTAARTGLTGLLDRDPATLSGGELRRLAVACAVIAEPDILILDEPLASLDAAGAAQIRDLVRSLCGAGTAPGPATRRRPGAGPPPGWGPGNPPVNPAGDPDRQRRPATRLSGDRRRPAEPGGRRPRPRSCALDRSRRRDGHRDGRAGTADRLGRTGARRCPPTPQERRH